jgi:hypothetical protein
MMFESSFDVCNLTGIETVNDRESFIPLAPIGGEGRGEGANVKLQQKF